MVDVHVVNWWEGLMNRIGIISNQTASEATIKAERIRKVGDGKS